MGQRASLCTGWAIWREDQDTCKFYHKGTHAQMMPYRKLCNDLQREGVKPSPDLAFGLFCCVPLHKIWYGIEKCACLITLPLTIAFWRKSVYLLVHLFLFVPFSILLALFYNHPEETIVIFQHRGQISSVFRSWGHIHPYQCGWPSLYR